MRCKLAKQNKTIIWNMLLFLLAQMAPTSTTLSEVETSGDEPGPSKKSKQDSKFL